MLMVSQLARKYSLSRTTLLYYERVGLLVPHSRSDNGYRWYGNNESKRLETILSYRSLGVSITTIISLLDRKQAVKQDQVLHDQFNALEKEIQTLRQQQKAIIALLECPELIAQEGMTKEEWIAILQATGFNEEDMQNWHRNFEAMAPEGHQAFLASLNIDSDEIATIRAWSKV